LGPGHRRRQCPRALPQSDRPAADDVPRPRQQYGRRPRVGPPRIRARRHSDLGARCNHASRPISSRNSRAEARRLDRLRDDCDCGHESRHEQGEAAGDAELRARIARDAKARSRLRETPRPARERVCSRVGSSNRTTISCHRWHEPRLRHFTRCHRAPRNSSPRSCARWREAVASMRRASATVARSTWQFRVM